MNLTISPFLRKALLADALVSGLAAALLIAGAGALGSLLALPQAFLFWTGVVLVPFVALLVLTACRRMAPRLLVLDIALVNVLWVAASFAVLLAGLVSPNLLGVAFIAVQALAVALFAALQFTALRAAPLAV